MAQEAVYENLVRELERLKAKSDATTPKRHQGNARKSTPRMSVVVLAREPYLSSPGLGSLTIASKTSEVYGKETVTPRPVIWPEQWVPGTEYGASLTFQAGISLLLPPVSANIPSEPHLAWINTDTSFIFSPNNPNPVLYMRGGQEGELLQPHLLEGTSASALSLPSNAYTRALLMEPEPEPHRNSATQSTQQRPASSKTSHTATSSANGAASSASVSKASKQEANGKSNASNTGAPTKRHILDYDRPTFTSDTATSASASKGTHAANFPQPSASIDLTTPAEANSNGFASSAAASIESSPIDLEEGETSGKKKKKRKRADWAEDSTPSRGTGRPKKPRFPDYNDGEINLVKDPTTSQDFSISSNTARSRTSEYAVPLQSQATTFWHPPSTSSTTSDTSSSFVQLIPEPVTPAAPVPAPVPSKTTFRVVSSNSAPSTPQVTPTPTTTTAKKASTPHTTVKREKGSGDWYRVKPRNTPFKSRWTVDEENLLNILLDGGANMNQMTSYLHRTPNAITARLYDRYSLSLRTRPELPPISNEEVEALVDQYWMDKKQGKIRTVLPASNHHHGEDLTQYNSPSQDGTYSPLSELHPEAHYQENEQYQYFDHNAHHNISPDVIEVPNETESFHEISYHSRRHGEDEDYDPQADPARKKRHHPTKRSTESIEQ